jgi:hypothetical protein
VLWLLLGFYIAFLGASYGSAFLLFDLTLHGAPSLSLDLRIVEVVNYSLPIIVVAILYLLLRNRNRRMDRRWERVAEPPLELPANLIEASLVELDTTGHALKSVRRRIWWTVFLGCLLSISVVEYVAASVEATVAFSARTMPLSPLGQLGIQLGAVVGGAGLVLAWFAIYWRRVERRLKDLQTATDSRRAAVASFERALWERV